MFASHLDLLFCDTHPKNVYFQLHELRGSFQTSSQLQKFFQMVFARDQNCIYRDHVHPSCSKPIMLHCETLAVLDTTQNKPRDGLAVSYGNSGKQLDLQCSVVLDLGAFSKEEIPEQGAVLEFLGTQKHEQKDLFNFFSNCPIFKTSHSLSIVYILDSILIKTDSVLAFICPASNS